MIRWLFGRLKPEVEEVPATAAPFSLEFTICGRNDDYEPNWDRRLEAVLAYNRARFESTNVDFRVAFVEWNPPPNRDLLSPRLVEKFPFLRAIVVDRGVHGELCESQDLVMMLNFSLNSAVRTSKADYVLITGGDCFLGRDTVRWMKTEGLAPKCLYRAERVDIRPDIDFAAATPDVIERRRNIVRVNRCDVPPFDQPPYVQACGDFILMDRESFQLIRGFDEGIRHARLHLDSRCCLTAMAYDLDCKLIGRVYHINHTQSYINRPQSYPGAEIKAPSAIPYKNPDTWGLGDRQWEQRADRLVYVS